MQIELKELYPSVYYLQFKSQYDITMTMIRFQEFYESKYPNILHKYFTIEEFMDTYSADTGNFTYCTDWSGFNIPSSSLIGFLEVYRGKLRNKEIQVIELLTDIIMKGEKFYVIAGYEDRVIVHEMAHALYYLDSDYKFSVDILLDSLPKELKSRFTGGLDKATYAEHVHRDEMQAYCIDNIHTGSNQLPQMKVKDSDKVYFQQFYNLFKEYYNG